MVYSYAKEGKVDIQNCVKESFSVIGKEGSTNDGDGFIQKLWNEANSHFAEIEALAKKDGNGAIGGIWGLMSDVSHSFNPWENDFSKGLYLAGVEVTRDALAPQNWIKWTVPSYEYLYVLNECADTFQDVINYMEDNNIQLVGAAHDFNCPQTQQGYIFFPIRKL